MINVPYGNAFVRNCNIDVSHIYTILYRKQQIEHYTAQKYCNRMMQKKLKLNAIVHKRLSDNLVEI